MQLEDVTAEIRPRSDWEAADLGFALVRRDFWRCLAGWWLAMGLPAAVAAALLWDDPMMFLFLFWWFKPAGARVVLFELSRRLFGEKPGWRAVLREIPRAWTRRFFHRFVVGRLSPWLPVVLPVEDLEGLRGAAYRQRTAQVTRRGGGAVMWLYFLGDLAALWVALGVLGVVAMLIPQGPDAVWTQAMDQWSPETPFEIPLVLSRLITACLMVALPVTDLLVTGAGFGIYLNNRTWLEGWDIELAFRRLARRLGPAVVVLATCLLAGASRAGTPAEDIRAVKAHEDFRVHSVTERIPQSRQDSSISLPLQELAGIITVGVVVIGLGFLVVWLWRHRHVLARRGNGPPVPPAAPGARVVMGMEISAGSLPADVPGAALALWQAGRHHEALALLYRGAISRAVQLAHLEIHESDTEGDCLRRVESAGPDAAPDYFRRLTAAWMHQAYAGVAPPDDEVRTLCSGWPYVGGGVR